MLALFFALSTPASAYFVANISEGRVIVSQGQVLGDDDENKDENKEEKREEKKEEKREEKREEQKPQENKVEEKRMEQVKEQQKIKREVIKETAKIQKKLDINSKNVKLLIDPNKNSLSVNVNSDENSKKLKELEKKRVELEKELTKKIGEGDKKQKEILMEQLKKNNEASRSFKSKLIDEVEDDNLEINSNDGLKVRSDDDGNENELEVEKEDVKVKSLLPVGINAETNNLIVKTPKSEVETEHTPDRVLEDLKTKSILDDFSVDSASEAESNIIIEDDKPVYEIKGTKKARFLWVLPVNIDKEVKVSVETGEVLNTTQSNFSKFLDLLSF